MERMTVGKLRGMRQLANRNGMLTMCAMDHRASLRRSLEKETPETITYQDMVDFKLDLCQVLAPISSAVLLDPIYGAAQAIASGILPGQTGLLVSVEQSGYAGGKYDRTTRLLPGWNVRKTKRMGASAVKLLVYFRPDLRDTTEKQLKLVKGVSDDCAREDLPLLVEAVSYPKADEEKDLNLYTQALPDILAETAKLVTALPVDVFKAEFPGDIKHEPDEKKLYENCKRLDESSRAPWVLLSGGEEYTFFKRQVEIACRAGASGFLAGRTLWQEAAGMESREERIEFFHSVVARRLKELSAIANDSGTSWYVRGGCSDGRFDIVAEGWYKKYR